MQKNLNEKNLNQKILNQEKLKQIIGEVMENEKIAGRINENSDLVDDIGMDSLTIINFILRVEDEFEVEIDFDEFDVENLRSLNVFAGYIESKQQE